MRHRRMFTCIAAALGVGVALPGGAAALPTDAGPTVPLTDYCKTATPHKTLSYAGSAITATSAGGTYYYSPSQGCKRFIVDVSVGASKNLILRGEYADSQSGPANPPLVLNPLALSQPACESYSQHVSVYSKTLVLGSGFVLKASTSFKGVWMPDKYYAAIQLYVPAHCERAWQSGSPESTLENHSTSIFGAKFRVTVDAKSTTYKQVKVVARPA